MQLHDQVLVVDGDTLTSITLRLALQKDRYIIHGATTGLQGINLVTSADTTFRLIFIDLQLPDMSGLEVIAELHESRPTIPLVLMSTRLTCALHHAALRLGCSAVVAKPIHDVLTVVQHVIGEDFSNAGTPDEVLALAGHAAARWLSVVMPVTRLRTDVRTVDQWARHVGRSPATLKTWCRAAQVTAAQSLDFARILRIARLYGGRSVDWYHVLAVVEARTLSSMLKRWSIRREFTVPIPKEFVRTQQVITVPELLLSVEYCIDHPSVELAI